MVAKEIAVIASRLLDELKERLTSAYGHRLHAVGRTRFVAFLGPTVSGPEGISWGKDE